MKLREMMIEALMVGAPESARPEVESWVLPEWMLPRGEWKKGPEDEELDGVTWTDAVPGELGEDGRAWLIDGSGVLWVTGYAGRGTLCYFRFERA